MRIPYEILVIAVDKLYDKVFPVGTSNEVISKYCEFISDTIVASGWTIDDFSYEYVNRGLPNLNPQMDRNLN